MRNSILLISVYPIFLFAAENLEHQNTPEVIKQLQNKGKSDFNVIASNTEIKLSENNDRANIVSLNDYADANKQEHYLNGNVIPVVNLNESDHDGVSHNYFSKLDLDKKQAVYFNNRNMINPANIVIAEINSIEKTILAGHIGLLGKDASLVVANPKGIDCVSCSFKGMNNITLLAGEIDRKKGDRIEFKKAFDKSVTMSGYIDLSKISNVDIYADKIFIYRQTIIKADKMNFNIHNGIEYYTDRKYSKGRMRNPIVSPSSKNSGFYFNPWSEINANDLNINLVNANFINSGDLYGRKQLKINIFNYDNHGERQNSMGSRVATNSGVISSGKDMFISPNKIKNIGYGLTTAVNKEGKVYHYNLTSQNH